MTTPTTTPTTPTATGAAAPRDFRSSRGPRPAGQGGRGGSAAGGQGGRGGQGARRGGSRRPEKPRSEYDHKLLDIRRVARVSAGGRRFNFSVTVVIGNRKGSVGIGLGKAGDTQLAIEKATRDARKHMIHVNLTKNRSIPHEVEAKYSSARVVIYPSTGRGLVAGSAIRDVLEFAGITDVNAKLLSGSKNKLNISRVAIKALRQVAVAKPATVPTV